MKVLETIIKTYGISTTDDLVRIELSNRLKRLFNDSEFMGVEIGETNLYDESRIVYKSKKGGRERFKRF